MIRPSVRSLFGARSIVSICTLFSLSVCSVQAVAGTITFNDLTDTLSVSLTGSDSARYSFLSGQPLGCLLEVCTVMVAAPTGYVRGTGIGIVGPANILEPGTGSLLSDTYQENIASNGGSYTLIFTSDATVPLPSNTFSLQTIRETGSVQALDTLTWFGTGPPPISDQVFFASSVPEPASLALFGSGLVGLGCWRRRQLIHGRC